MTERAMRVLLIEDDPIDAESVRRNLARAASREPIDLDWVEELGSGIERLSSGAFDLVLLDLGLPDSDGLATLVQLRECDGSVPVVVLTGARDLESAVEERGAQAYLVKEELRQSGPLLHSLRYALERHRVAREKLASLGVLSAGIAMGFNRLLGSILEHAENAAAELEDPKRLASVRQRLEEIQKEALRAESMTSQLRDYAAHGSTPGRRVDLSSFVVEASDLIDSLVPPGVEVSYDVATPGATAQVSHLQLHQILLALVMNAFDAMQGRPGRVAISAGVRNVDERILRDAEGSPDARPGCYASLSVLDTGSGMDEATRRRIFEPFFGTRAAGRGLGLAAASGIARQCGAVIVVSSHLEVGSCFEVLFPHADRGPANGSRVQ